MIVKVKDIRAINHNTIKAFFTLQLEEIGMEIKDCKLILTKNGQEYFVGFPSKKEDDGTYTNLVTIDKDKAESKDFQTTILKLILDHLEKQPA